MMVILLILKCNIVLLVCFENGKGIPPFTNYRSSTCKRTPIKQTKEELCFTNRFVTDLHEIIV